MAVCDLTTTVTNQPLDPTLHIPLFKMKYSSAILEQCIDGWAGLDWFQPEVQTSELTNDFNMGHSLRIRYKEHENPFDSVLVEDVTYAAGEDCPHRLDEACTPGCISTGSSWRVKDVLYDKKFRTGASWCVETESLTYGDLESRFTENVEKTRTVISINSWSKLICDAIAAPHATEIPTDAACFPTHFYQAGLASVNAVDILKKVTSYLKTRCQGTEMAIFTHRYFEQDMTDCDAFCSYEKTGVSTPAAQVDSLVQGGWSMMPSLPRGIWGKGIMIAPDSVDLYRGGVNYNPFLNDDGTKYYMLIASKRSFFTGVTPLMDMKFFPATCDNKNEAIQQTWLTFNCILFPEEVFVLEFDVNCQTVPERGRQYGRPLTRIFN